MKIFLKYIRDSFNTKTYKWIDSDLSFRKVVFFKTEKNKEIFLNFDEILPNVYNVHFYYLKDNKKTIELSREGEEFQIFGNIKNAITEFININPDIEFIGYSSNEQEREDLYVMYLKQIPNNFKTYWKTINKISYYFIMKKELEPMISDMYEKKFIEYDGKTKKYE